MFSSFVTAFGAVIPFFIYLGVGYLLVRSRQADAAFMNQMNRVSFNAFFPFMMFYNVYKVTPEALPSVKLGIGALLSLSFILVVSLITVPRLVRENPRRGVIIQGLYRTNYLLYGTPLMLSIFGDKYAGTAGIMVMIVVTFFNITSVIVLELFSGEGKVNLRDLPLNLAKNPLLQGCVIGLLFFMLGIHLPDFLEKPISALANIATPLSLITLGGTLRFDAIRKNAGVLTRVLLIKMILIPSLALFFGYAVLGFRGAELFLYFVAFATPVATSSYPMALNMGGDAELAGQIVFISTLVSLGTLFLFIFFMAQMGILMG